jgi:CMP-N-acetylneuraminic acid synthetase
VTARGGSKRLPDKNIRPLAGRPLIEWSISSALAAHNVRRVIVSTDSPHIARTARDAGAETPFLRPDELSGDTASHYDVVEHAIDWLEKDEGRVPTYLCLLQPTSPLRTAGDIDAIVELVCCEQADSAFAVTRAKAHPALMYRLDGTSASPYLPPSEGYLRSQDLEPLYYVNGALYVIRPDTFRQRATLMSPAPAVYIMPEERSVDIDDEADFRLAEALVAASGREGT